MTKRIVLPYLLRHLIVGAAYVPLALRQIITAVWRLKTEKKH